MCSSMTVFAEANVDVDLRMLRSFRVLRPLKLVSRIPSKQQLFDRTNINRLFYKIEQKIIF
jgi:hypothetical protein